MGNKEWLLLLTGGLASWLITRIAACIYIYNISETVRVRFSTDTSMTDLSLVEPSSVDLVWTRDSMLYLDRYQKAQAVDAFTHWLRPGGKFMIGDFGRADSDLSEAYLQYCESTQVHTLTNDEYVEVLEASGKLVVARFTRRLCTNHLSCKARVYCGSYRLATAELGYIWRASGTWQRRPENNV
jgi:hypothetical protein